MDSASAKVTEPNLALICSGDMLRTSVAVLALATSLPPRATVAQGPTTDVLTRASELADAGRYGEAGRMLRDELVGLPESRGNRGRRNRDQRDSNCTVFL